MIEGSRASGQDEPYRREVEAALGKLPPIEIGADGTIQEWIEDYEEREPGHRHMSHLIGLYLSPCGVPQNEKSANFLTVSSV